MFFHFLNQSIISRWLTMSYEYFLDFSLYLPIYLTSFELFSGIIFSMFCNNCNQKTTRISTHHSRLQSPNPVPATGLRKISLLRPCCWLHNASCPEWLGNPDPFWQWNQSNTSSITVPATLTLPRSIVQATWFWTLTVTQHTLFHPKLEAAPADLLHGQQKQTTQQKPSCC